MPLVVMPWAADHDLKDARLAPSVLHPAVFSGLFMSVYVGD